LKSNSLPPDNKNVTGHLLNLKKIKNFFIKKYNKVRKKNFTVDKVKFFIYLSHIFENTKFQ